MRIQSLLPAHLLGQRDPGLAHRTRRS